MTPVFLWMRDKSVSHGVCVLQLPQVDVLHCSLEGAQAVAEFIFSRVAEAEVPHVAQVGHPANDTIQESLLCRQNHLFKNRKARKAERPQAHWKHTDC